MVSASFISSWSLNYAIHDADDPERLRKGCAGHYAGPPGGSRDDEIQRIPATGRRTADARRLAAALDGRARLILGWEGHRNRWALCRNEGSNRRILDDSGEVEGRGRRMGHPLPRVGPRSRGAAPGAGVLGFSRGNAGNCGKISRDAEAEGLTPVTWRG